MKTTRQSLTDLEVVQRRLHQLRGYNMYCKACSAVALPPSLLAPTLEPFRHQYRLPNCSTNSFLHKYDPRKDMGV